MNRNGFVIVLLFVVFMCGIVHGVTAGECYQENGTWEIGNDANIRMTVSPGIAIGSSGDLYISTLTYNSDGTPGGKILKIGPDGTSTLWGPTYGFIEGPSGNQVVCVPLGVAVDSARSFVYITEMEFDPGTGNAQYYIHKFTLDGTTLKRWGPFGSGMVGGLDPMSLLSLPRGLALDPAGNVYVTSVLTTEATESQVLVFDSEGTPVSQWNVVDQDNVKYIALGIAIDSSGNVYVPGMGAPNGNLVTRVLKFDTNGAFATQWDIPVLDTGMNLISGIAVDSAGDVYVNRVRIVIGENNVLSEVLKYDALGVPVSRGILAGPDAVGMHLPAGIAVDGAERAYITEMVGDLNSETFTTRLLQFVPGYCDKIVNLGVSIQAPLNVERDNTLIYTLHYYNIGTDTANNVVLEDFLDPNVEIVTISSPGEYNPVSRSVKWDLNTLDWGDHGYETIQVTIGDGVITGDNIVNRATISTIDPEINLVDNVAVVTTQVTNHGLPSGIDMGPTNGGGSVYWETPITINYQSPANTTRVSYLIHIDDDGPVGGTDITGDMVQDTNDPGLWTIPPITFYPRHGSATVTLIAYNTVTPPSTTDFSFYIDPAGYIFDLATGARIEGATVWLQRPTITGEWENVPPGLTPATMIPDSNPLVTGKNGQYQWDVLPGSYRVHVEAAGYLPADSIVVSIPPPVMDLHVGLMKEGSTEDTAPPTTTMELTGTTGLNGWYRSDVTVTLMPTDNGGSGVAITKYSIDGITWSNYQDPFIISKEGTTNLRYWSADNAGNQAGESQSDIQLDMTTPDVTIEIPGNDMTYILNEIIGAVWSAQDTISGIGSAKGTVSSGETIDTSAPGVKVFWVNATDNAGNTKEKSSSYTVQTTADACRDLITQVKSANLPEGTENSLISKIDAAVKALDKGNPNPAKNQIEAFINEVKAQQGKKIPANSADPLIRSAQRIISNC